jgi:hypothetical protein
MMMTSGAGPIDQKQAVWCLHCERAYQKGERRLMGGLDMCPYPGCDGDAVIDQWKWSRIREVNPRYPEVPERGVVYQLHGPDYQHPSKKRQTRT